MWITVTVTYKYKLQEIFLQFLEFSEVRNRHIPFDLYKCSCPTSPAALTITLILSEGRSPIRIHLNLLPSEVSKWVVYLTWSRVVLGLEGGLNPNP